MPSFFSQPSGSNWGWCCEETKTGMGVHHSRGVRGGSRITLQPSFCSQPSGSHWGWCCKGTTPGMGMHHAQEVGGGSRIPLQPSFCSQPSGSNWGWCCSEEATNEAEPGSQLARTAAACRQQQQRQQGGGNTGSSSREHNSALCSSPANAAPSVPSSRIQPQPACLTQHALQMIPPHPRQPPCAAALTSSAE